MEVNQLVYPLKKRLDLAWQCKQVIFKVLKLALKDWACSQLTLVEVTCKLIIQQISKELKVAL